MARQKRTKRASATRVLHPEPRLNSAVRRWWKPAAILVVAVGVGVALGAIKNGGSKQTGTGLPHTSDYHSLLVSPTNARDLLLGTHQGLYRSGDGGRTWRFASLSGNDAMNLARPNGKMIWFAGHNVFKKSVDGGLSWKDVRPAGLPSLDIHGFTVDPRNAQSLYAAVAGQGLYHSRDGARSFELASSQVGGSVMALAVTKDGRLLAGDMQRGLLESRDVGRTWRVALPAQVMGLAIDPHQPQRVLATGPGIARSLDGGRNWKPILDLSQGAGPVAWSASNPGLAYVVGFNRKLYRSSNGGASWETVR